MRKLILAIVAACAMGAHPVRATPILVNGDFQTGTLSGWTASGAVSVVQNTDYVRSGGATGDTGTGFVADFGANNGSGGALSQSIATVAGQVYILSFQYGAIGSNHAAQEIRVTAGNLNGTVISAVSNNDLSTALASYTVRFTASASHTRITFANISPVSRRVDGLLDNVAVPEPASLLLLATGLVSIGLTRRRHLGC